MTSKELKALLPDDDRPVKVWVEVDGFMILANVKDVDRDGSVVTLSVSDYLV